MMMQQEKRILNILMEGKNMPEEHKPEVIVFAGPNGSGKSTIFKIAYVNGIKKYINADDIKASTGCSDLDAAQKAESLRENALMNHEDFIFETVLSTDRNLNLLKKAKKHGYFIRCIYVLTKDPEINIIRVRSRTDDGGHDVPEDKIISRYHKSLTRIPQLVDLCDIIHIYDNSKTPFRIYKKRKDQEFFWPNEFWNVEKIHSLIGKKV